jgi:hypothetical protein
MATMNAKLSFLILLGLLANAEAQNLPTLTHGPEPVHTGPSTGPTGPYNTGPLAPVQNFLYQIEVDNLPKNPQNTPSTAGSVGWSTVRTSGGDR